MIWKAVLIKWYILRIDTSPVHILIALIPIWLYIVVGFSKEKKIISIKKKKKNFI